MDHFFLPLVLPRFHEAGSYFPHACGGYLAYPFVKVDGFAPECFIFLELWLSQMKGCKSISCICIEDADACLGYFSYLLGKERG